MPFMTPSKEMEWVYSFNLDSTSGLRPGTYMEHLAVVYLMHRLPYVTSNTEKKQGSLSHKLRVQDNQVTAGD